MNYRTTTVLLVILAALAAYIYFFGSSPKTSNMAEDDNLQVLNFDEESVNSLEVREAGSVVLVKKNADGRWELAKPEQFEGDQSRMESVVYTIARLRASRVVSTNPDDLSAYGLSKPEVEVVVGAAGSDPVELLIGSENPAGSGNYVKRSGSDTVYLVSSYSVSQLRGLIDEPPKAKPTPTPSPSSTPEAVPTAQPEATGTPIP